MLHYSLPKVFLHCVGSQHAGLRCARWPQDAANGHFFAVVLFYLSCQLLITFITWPLPTLALIVLYLVYVYLNYGLHSFQCICSVLSLVFKNQSLSAPWQGLFTVDCFCNYCYCKETCLSYLLHRRFCTWVQSGFCSSPATNGWTLPVKKKNDTSLWTEKQHSQLAIAILHICSAGFLFLSQEQLSQVTQNL